MTLHATLDNFSYQLAWSDSSRNNQTNHKKTHLHQCHVEWIIGYLQLFTFCWRENRFMGIIENRFSKLLLKNGLIRKFCPQNVNIADFDIYIRTLLVQMKKTSFGIDLIMSTPLKTFFRLYVKIHRNFNNHVQNPNAQINAWKWRIQIISRIFYRPQKYKMMNFFKRPDRD